jgi:CheY-like chemotaxis protein
MRLDTGYLPFEFRMLDLGATVREVLSRLPADPAHPVSAEVPEDPVPCWADRERMLEVLENLLSNAIKYSPGGGSVHVEVCRVGDQAEVRVSDQGLGIPADQMDRLFLAFSRIRSPQVAAIEGSGLGLYICDRIVRAHGGRVWASSQEGRGSSFALSLPLYGPAARVQTPLVLVAAGDESTRRQVRRLAREAGLDCFEVSDGVEAVEAAIRLGPQAVVLDQILPRLRAEAVAARLRDRPSTASIPVVALATGAGREADPAPFSARLPKPLDRAGVRALAELMDIRLPEAFGEKARQGEPSGLPAEAGSAD